jgi:lysophospholipase L1-like esterase
MIDILILGDSLVADYDWQARIPSERVTTFGMPGIGTANLLSLLPAIKQKVDRAAVIMVMAGTNDLLAGDLHFGETLKKIYVQLRHDYPGGEILATSLLPMDLPHLPPGTIVRLNSEIAALSMQTGCCYLDIHSRFSGSAKVIFQEDGVHLTVAAYEIWTRALLEHIAFLVEDD